MKATLIKKESLGDVPGIKDEIPLGTVYQVDPTRMSIHFLQNKKSGKITPVPSIWADPGDGARAGWLPLEFLKMEPTTEEEIMLAMEDGVEDFSPKYMN